MVTTRAVAFTMNFRLNKKVKKNGFYPIYVRLTVNNKRVEFATRLSISIRQWNQQQQKAIGQTDEVNSINQQLTLIKADIQRHYNRIVALEKPVTAELLKNQYLGIREKEHLLKETLEYYHDRFKEKVVIGQKAANTLKCIHTTNEKIKAFIKYRFKVSDMKLSDIKTSFLPELEHYLITKDKLSNNSAMKYIHTFKRIIKFAVDQGWMDKNPTTQFRCSYNPPQRERLTMEEIMRLYQKELPQRLAEVRDVFVFCCFTGFSYIDVYQLSAENIITGIDGGKWVVKSREKTGTSETVPLLSIAQEIIGRYKNDLYCETKGCLLPVNTNQCYNAYLKEIAILCDIKKHLTTHIARHTFATTVTLENDVPIETVSKMLGHKNIKTTQLYAKVTERKISNNMKDLSSKLERILNNDSEFKRV